MMTQINIERVSGSLLARNVWTFYYDDRQQVLRLVGYMEQRRQTRRHKWVVQRVWSSYNHRGSGIPQPESIPADVQADARQAFIERLTVAIGF
jgi:hypothetical protein